MIWSFDDMNIGLTKDNTCLQTREIPRPAGLSSRDWYAHAANVCKKLNELKTQ